MTAPPAGALEACLALLEKAVPGGWRWSPNGNIVPAHYTDDCEIAAVYSEHMDDVDVPDNAAAIIAAVNFLRAHGPALLAALRLREGWRPIESAPRDVDVLVYEPIGRYSVAMLNDEGWMTWDIYKRQPTLWKPIDPPAPPTDDDLARVLEQTT